MYMVLFVLDDASLLDRALTAWDEIGVTVIDLAFALVGLLGLVLTGLALVGNIARVERRFVFVEVDAFLILLVYLLGMWFLYNRGIGV